MASWKSAFALPKSQVNIATPAGTVEIFEHDECPEDGITRYPKPSQDPRDPLNYGVFRKAAALLVVSVYAFVANFTSSVIAPGLQLWPTAFSNDPRPYSDLSKFIAVHVLFLGLSNIWWVPLSNWAGRRPVLLVGTLLMTVCSIWCAVASSYGSLLAARILQGAGGGAADTVAPALVGELYFIHERGRAMAVYTILLLMGSIGGGLVGGYIAFDHGWSAMFWVSVALSAFCFIAVALLVPETLYDRETAQEERLATLAEKQGASASQIDHPQEVEYKPLTYLQCLGFRHVRKGLLPRFLRPWRTLALPGTWVVMLHYAALVGGIVTISSIGAQLVASPPYLWGANAGLINLGGLIGAVIGYAYTSLLSDSRLKANAKKRGRGIAEAEDRLPTLFFPLTIATCGFFVFGFCAQYPGGNRWVGLQVGYGMLSFGLMQVPSVGFNYLIDAYSTLAADCFTVVTILRSIIAFAWTFFAANWVESKGPAEPFGIFGMLMGIFSLLSIPLWFYGKRMRIATSSFVERWTSQDGEM